MKGRHLLTKNVSKISFMEYIDFDSDLPFRIFATSVSNIPIHMHQCKELIVVLKGSLRVKISFDNYPLKEGDFLFINSYEAHAFSCEDECILLVLKVDNGQFEGDLFVYEIDYYRNYNHDQVNKVKWLMVNLYKILNTAKGYETVEMRRLVKKITRICDKYFQIKSCQMQERIRNDYRNNANRSEIMRQVYESLHNSYKNVCGTDLPDIRDSVKIIQLHKAELLLLGTKMSVESLSKKVGFSSTGSFRKLFKQYFHMAPIEYRKKLQGNLYPAAKMNHCIIKGNNIELLACLHKLLEEYDGEKVEEFLWNDLHSALNYIEFLIDELQMEDKFVIVKPNKTINAEIIDKDIIITITVSNE